MASATRTWSCVVCRWALEDLVVQAIVNANGDAERTLSRWEPHEPYRTLLSNEHVAEVRCSNPSCRLLYSAREES